MKIVVVVEPSESTKPADPKVDKVVFSLIPPKSAPSQPFILIYFASHLKQFVESALDTLFRFGNEKMGMMYSSVLKCNHNESVLYPYSTQFTLMSSE